MTLKNWLVWMPRVLLILFACFLSIFALDVFVEGRPWGEMLLAFLIHLTPAWLVLLVLIFAWRWPWIGAAGCALLAIAHVALMSSRHMHISAFLAIDGPLVVIAGLFYLSWRLARS